MARDWQLMFISVRLFYCLNWCLRRGAGKSCEADASSTLRAPAGRILIYRLYPSHVVYIWADANFYRPITMQALTCRFRTR